MRCRCYNAKPRKVWTGFRSFILIRRCEMHLLRDAMTARLKREIWG